MINYLKGTLVSKIENSPTGTNITVEVNNIGYLIITNKRVVASLPKEGEIVTIYTSLIHREDSMTLCGFSSREERDLFTILTSVSGIGPKVALVILEGLGAYNLVNAVISDDDKAISKAKGVGPKLAKKIILEVKEKMTKWRDTAAFDSASVTDVEGFEATESCMEAETVLLSLGYTKKEVAVGLTRALSCVENKNDSEEILRSALQWMVDQEG